MRMRDSSVVFSAACVALFLAGCASRGRYTPPAPIVPAATNYKETGNWKTAEPGDELSKGDWWQIYNDPQLSALEEEAEVSNQNLKAARDRYLQARALLRQKQAALKPAADGGVSFTQNRQSENRPLGHSAYSDFLIPLDFSYEADVWGRLRYAVQSSRASAQASAADLETVNLSVQAELAQDYLELRGLDAEQELLDSTVEAYEKALELTQNRFEGGLAAQGDVAKAETQLEATRAQAVDIAVQRAQTEHAIAVLVGKPVSDFSLPVMPLRTPPPPIPIGVPSQLVERRPDIASAERKVAAANAQIGVAHAAFFPVLSLKAPTGFESTSLLSWLTGPSAFFGLGPAVALPLFDGGRRRAVTDQMRQEYEEAVADYQQTVLAAFQEVEDSLASVRVLQDEAEVQDRAVAAAERSLAISLNRYQGGLSNYLEVTTAQTAALENKRAAMQILRRRALASVQLIKALGGGWNVSSLPTN